jgi:cytosine deaminase
VYHVEVLVCENIGKMLAFLKYNLISRLLFERGPRFMDLIIRKGKHRDRPGTWDIGIRGERVASVAEHLPERGRREIDAGGRLVAPTYVNGRVHLDNSNVGDIMRLNKPNSFQECLEIAGGHKRTDTVEHEE